MADKKPLSPYLFALAKSVALCPSDATEMDYLLHVFTRMCHSESLLTTDVERQVVRREVKFGDYRLLCFHDETAALFGPEGVTDCLSVDVHSGGDHEGEAYPGYITAERWVKDTPAWVTDDILEGLHRESIG